MLNRQYALASATMFLALYDYFRYRLQRGIYGADPASNIMAVGHERRVAKETLDLLRTGDLILCQRLDSALSWAIMYFGGRYAVDHAAIYIADGRVLHMTLTGLRHNAIDTLARGARILPVRLPQSDGTFDTTPDTEESRAVYLATMKRIDAHRKANGDFPAPYASLILSALGIVLGLRPATFRWRYYADVGVLAALVDAILWPLNHFPMSLTLWMLWLGAIIVMQWRFHRAIQRGQPSDEESHPGLFIRHIMLTGALIFPGRPISGRWQVQVAPLPMRSASRRPKARQSQNPR